MTWLWCAISFAAGTLWGVFLMCMVQAIKDDS